MGMKIGVKYVTSTWAAEFPSALELPETEVAETATGALADTLVPLPQVVTLLPIFGIRRSCSSAYVQAVVVSVALAAELDVYKQATRAAASVAISA